MLGAVALLAMLAGVFAVAGAVFDWEFLFSDGRHAREWAASMGRAAARTAFGLAGGGLLAVGFVSRVIAVASMPVSAAPAVVDSTVVDSTAVDSTAPPVGESNATGPGSHDVRVPTPADERGPVNSPSPARARQNTPSTATAPPPPASPAQIITLWNPTAALEPEGTTLFTVEYRFESGHRPRAGEHYFWMIDLSDKTRALEFDGDVLQVQGQLRHVIQTPPELATGLGIWQTFFRLGIDDSGREVSNRLTISGDKVKSTSLVERNSFRFLQPGSERNSFRFLKSETE